MVAIIYILIVVLTIIGAFGYYTWTGKDVGLQRKLDIAILGFLWGPALVIIITIVLLTGLGYVGLKGVHLASRVDAYLSRRR